MTASSASLRMDGFIRPPAAASPLPSKRHGSEVDRSRHLGQRGGVDDALAQVGQLAFWQVVILLVGDVGDLPAEHGITEELEPLVGRVARPLGAPRAMRHGTLEQTHVDELVAQPLH